MLKKNKILLKFPLNIDGEDEGISGPGIEHFTGKTVESLCKEVLQNSLDARIGNNKVIVKFELIELKKEDIPEVDNLIKSLNSCLSYKKSEKVQKIFKKSLESLKTKTIKVLRISDFGTSGLTGSKEKENSNFHNLVKSSGASDKGGVAGGSFGIGKFAPFACSYPRTIFYSTLDTDGSYAFQGVSRLITHLVDGVPTRGVGYIGDPNGNKPIVDKALIPINFLRDEVGTDINIIGFSGDNNWKESIITASLNSFFESIYEGKLEIQVQDEVINTDNFLEIGEKYLENKGNQNYTYEYFKCLVSSEGINKKVYKEDFIYEDVNYGEVELHLYKEKKFSKKVAYLRSTGMKIIDKGNFKTTLNFSGILKMNGKGINAFIRSLETPSHDKLEVERHDHPGKAKNILDSLNKLIRGKVVEFSGINTSEEIDVKGLSKYLPDRSKEKEILSYSIKNGKIKSVSQEKYEKKKNKDLVNKLEELKDLFNVEEVDETDPSIPHSGKLLGGKGETGELPKGKGGARGLPGGKRTSKNSSGEILTEKEKYEPGKRFIQMSKRKALINDTEGKRYKVILESIEDCQVLFQLKVKYEDGEGEIIEIDRSYLPCNTNLALDQDKKVLVELKSKEKKVVFVELKESVYSSMEVLINEK